MKNKITILGILMYTLNTSAETSFNINWQADTIRLCMEQMQCQKFMADSTPTCNIVVPKKHYQTILEGLGSKAIFVTASWCCGESKNAYLELITVNRMPVFVYFPWPCDFNDGLLYMDSCYLHIDFNKDLVNLIHKLYEENMKIIETPNGKHTRAMKCLDSLRLLEPVIKHINSFNSLVLDSIERPSKYGNDIPGKTDLLKMINILKSRTVSSNLVLSWDTLSMKYNISLPEELEPYVPEEHKFNNK